jgi:hypothetical protein
MSEIIELIPLTSSIIVAYAIIIGLFLYLSNKRKDNRKETLIYTYDICKNDTRNYELIFHPNNSNVENESSKLIIQSQQAEAIQYFEKLAIGIKSKLLDEEIIYDCYSRYFFLAQRNLKYAFLNYNNKYGDPNIYIEYFKLLNKWKNQKGFENV